MRKRLLSGLLVILLLVEVWTPQVYATETQPLQGEKTVMTSPDPGETVSPTMTPDIDETASPEIEPTESPKESAVPEVTITPSATVEPEETSEPNATETPEALGIPSESPEFLETPSAIPLLLPSDTPSVKESELLTSCSLGICNNGLGGIWIDINAEPYTVMNYGNAAYTSKGCAWFASARAKQLTGKGDTVWSGSSWWNNGSGRYGFSTGQSLKAPALACWTGHVAVIEKIDGDTVYLSEGGASGFAAYGGNDAAYGYTIIRTTTTSSVSSLNSGFLGYVYLSDYSGGEDNGSFPLIDGQYYYIWNRNAGRVLDSESSSEGARVVLGDKTAGKSSQMWKAVKQADGYSFISAATNYAMDVYGYSTENLAEIKQYSYHGNTNQRFRLVDRGSGYYSIHPICSGLGLDALNAGTSVGTPVIQYGYHGGNNMQWSFEACSNDPIGYIDSIQPGVGEFTVVGWALDKDLPTTPTDIHVYLGSGSERECVYSVTANKYRPDVGVAFPGAGDYHGFEFTVKTSKSGYQNLDIFAINIGGGTNNPLLYSQTIYITPDTTPPQITRVWYSDITNHSFRINATVSDNVGVTKVLFPTWRADQTGEQAVWLQGVYQADGSWAVSVDANYWECKESTYYTHVYAYDLAGNYATDNSLNLWLDRTGPTIYGTKWERISDDTIRISCNVDDYYGGVAKVSFPTWTDHNGQDDLKANWDETCIGTQKGNVWSWDVKDSDHNYEKGVYITHIYATDIFGNRTSGGIGYSFENRFIPDTFSYDGHKYEIYNDLLSWSEAKAKCEELGGHLVTITSQGEQDAITQAISSQVRPSYLIGGMTVNGSPTWITGEKFDYTNWCPGEPNNWNGIEYVYQMYKDNGKWNDVADVEDSMGFICEYEDLGDVPIEDIPAGGIPEGLWMAGLTDYTYTGKEIKPEVRVYDANRLLKKNTDYTISYANNINVNNFVKGKEPTILVKGKGNYSGEIKVTFNILPIDIGGVDFTSDNLAVAYNGKEQKVTPKLQWNGKQLKVNRDFSCEYGSTQAGAYQETGTYAIRIHGMGNFTGTREVQLSVTENKKQIISNATVSGIKTQPYTGSEICPSLSVTLNGKKLDEGTDYRLSYEKNVQIGTAYIIVQGIGNYSGSKRVSFKITGISMDKVKVENLTSAVYTGEKIAPACQLKYPISKTESITLKEGTDYNAVYSKNENAGTATVEFIGINGYSGKIKKTFKITPYDMETDVNNCFSFVIPDVVAYEKGGSRPEEEVYYLGRKLVKGTDYTVTYSNNTKVCADDAGEKQPVIVIKGKGNFKGTKQFTFRIGKQDIGNAKIVMNAPDKVFQNKKNNYTSKVTVKDANGKTLAAGKDYENIAYFYKNDTTLLNGTVRKAGSEATDKADVVPAGTVMIAKVNGKGNYAGTKSCEYRITKASIGSAKVTIATQSYTGSAITLSKEDIKVTMKGVPVEADEFDIVEGSYKNNVAKGTAKVTIKGKGNYGGTKEVTFKIKAKLFAWWKN